MGPERSIETAGSGATCERSLEPAADACFRGRVQPQPTCAMATLRRHGSPAAGQPLRPQAIAPPRTRFVSRRVQPDRGSAALQRAELGARAHLRDVEAAMGDGRDAFTARKARLSASRGGVTSQHECRFRPAWRPIARVPQSDEGRSVQPDRCGCLGLSGRLASSWPRYWDAGHRGDVATRSSRTGSDSGACLHT